MRRRWRIRAASLCRVRLICILLTRAPPSPPSFLGTLEKNLHFQDFYGSSCRRHLELVAALRALGITPQEIKFAVTVKGPW
uniref:Uncharacterized protein n=1 Tax=Romanomermis culicivorax TaxID=13658 RepID=A0A915HQX4_ROMCU